MKMVLRISGLLVLMLSLGGEFLLRQLPVSQGFYLDEVSDANAIARRLPNRAGVTSTGWAMESPSQVQINDQGFIYHRDFDSGGRKELAVIIGDSQIEAPLISPAHSLSQMTESLLSDAARIYPVGMSGAPLSQYLAWYRHMRETYNPKWIIFVISPNDYDESFDAYGLFPGFQYFDEQGDLRLRPYHRSMISKVASSSHLVAYILNNLDLIGILKSSTQSFQYEDQQATQMMQASAPVHMPAYTSVEPKFDPNRQRAGRKAIELFFKELNQDSVTPPKIHFMMAPERQGTYRLGVANAEELRKYTTPLGQEFREAALANGYGISELESVFRKAFVRCAHPLEFTNDIHWSARGQAVVAKTVAAWLSKNGAGKMLKPSNDCQF